MYCTATARIWINADQLSQYDSATIIKAQVNNKQHGSEKLWEDVKVYDDSFSGKLYLFGFEHGPTHLIRAYSHDSAFGCWLDELPTIPEEDLHEAYDMCDGEYRQAIENEKNPELIEGYARQDNATGTGVVALGHHHWSKTLKDYEARLLIEVDLF